MTPTDEELGLFFSSQWLFWLKRNKPAVYVLIEASLRAGYRTNGIDPRALDGK